MARRMVVSESMIIEQIRANGRTLSWVAREMGIERSSLDKKLRGTRPPLTEQQARHLRALLGMSVSLELIPYTPSAVKVEAVA